MPLTVTVQKGHDFSSGNVTRAALNSGAVPTVAITGAVDTTELSAGAVTNAKVGTNADISLSKISGQAEDSILLVGSSASTGAGAKTIKALAGSGGALIKEVDNKAEITPSDDTIIASKLLKTADTNVVKGLSDLDEVAVDDYVMVHDESVTGADLVRLKKAKVSSIQKVGSTEYNKSSIVVAGSGTDKTIAIDLDGAPFQVVTVDDGNTYVVSCTNPPASTIKLVTVIITGPSSGSSTLNFPNGWRWPERSADAEPSSIATTEVALLSLTVTGNQEADVIAAYAVTQ